VQDGLDVSIIDATDAIYDLDATSHEVVLNTEEIEKKKRLWTAVYTNYEMLGWYTLDTGAQPTASHMNIHRAICAFNEVPLFLVMNCSPDPEAKQLPLSIFEAEIHMINDVPTQIFVDIDFKLETAQAERVAVDQITKVTPTEGVSTLEVQNQSVNTSLRILERKVGIIIESLRCMKEGTVPVDQNILRKASRICQHLPAVDSSDFRSDFLNELVDCLLVTYLSSATKTSSSLSELTDTYSMVYGSSRRPF
jgi:COP9 signalosome complex subunit 6